MIIRVIFFTNFDSLSNFKKENPCRSRQEDEFLPASLYISLDICVDMWYTVNTMEYKHTQHQVFLLNYHFVWCPKRRKPVLVGQIKERLRAIVEGVAQEKGIDILSFEIQPNHVHLFVSAQPSIPIHDMVKAFKGRSSNLLRKEFPELLKLPSLWTHSYFVSTAGNVSSETIKKYIEAQS